MDSTDNKIKLIPYNTGMKHMRLPEYGRMIHEMAGQCLAIIDRDERTRCAYAIVDVMKTLHAEKGKDLDEHKLWDHLYVMTDFRLDVDSPYPMPDREKFAARPNRVPICKTPLTRRQYGRLTQRMADAVADMENGPEKDIMVELLANHMKKTLSLVNKDGVDDNRVFADLSDFSEGRINLTSEMFQLADFKEDPKAKAQSKKKKKNSFI